MENHVSFFILYGRVTLYFLVNLEYYRIKFHAIYKER